MDDVACTVVSQSARTECRFAPALRARPARSSRRGIRSGARVRAALSAQSAPRRSRAHDRGAAMTRWRRPAIVIVAIVQTCAIAGCEIEVRLVDRPPDAGDDGG